MRASAWMFSARLAWQRPYFRWMSLTTLLLVAAGSAFFLWKVLPTRTHAGTVVLHYNIYVGIDEVRAWTWAFLLPSVWLLLTLIDLAVAYGSYRSDKHFAMSLMTFAFFWCLPWAGALFYLTLSNV